MRIKSALFVEKRSVENLPPWVQPFATTNGATDSTLKI